MKADKAFVKKILEVEKKEEVIVKHTLSEFDEFRQEESVLRSNREKWNAEMVNMIKEYSVAEEEKGKAIECCLEILDKVRSKIDGNLEVNFSQGLHKYSGCEQELGVTVIKVVPINDEKPIYFFWDKQSVMECLVFIGGNERDAFLALKDENGDLTFMKLAEFYLLSIPEEQKPNQEVGLLTSFSCFTAKVFSTVLIGHNLLPIKTLLLTDGFKNWRNENEKKTDEKMESGSSAGIDKWDVKQMPRL